MPNLILVFIDVLKNIQTEKDYNEFITLLKELCLNDEIIFELVSNEEKLDLEKENKYFQLFYFQYISYNQLIALYNFHQLYFLVCNQ